MSELVSQLSKLDPFRFNHEDEDDQGDAIDGGGDFDGGVGARHVSKGQLRVSHALESFLIDQGVIAASEEGGSGAALRSLLEEDHVRMPPSLVDRSHPLPAYFVSSSHNTYLVAHQLYGESSAAAYETVIRAGARCVEIDCWDNGEDADEPRVTHGYTLVSNVLFRAVCERIRDVVDAVALTSTMAATPLLISLENHCGPAGQLRLVHIMKEVFGHRLLTEPVRDGGREHVTLGELGAKIVVIVEFHLADEASDEEDEQNAPSKVVIPELAQLGVYAQSVKPRDTFWCEAGAGGMIPHHQLANVSESGLLAQLPAHAEVIARHNARSMMRVYPRGTRVGSSNLRAVPFWAVGAQLCALNWQTFGTAMQLNRALFEGSGGYVLKPERLRPTIPTMGGIVGAKGVQRQRRRRRLSLHVAGATDVPLPEDREGDESNNPIKPYLSCTLFSGLDYSELDDRMDDQQQPAKRKTERYRHHRFGFLHSGENPAATDPVWDEVLEWEYDDDELVFVRMLIKSDDRWAPNPRLAVAAVRLGYVMGGWRFVRMLDLGGRETGCTVLVKFDIEDLE